MATQETFKSYRETKGAEATNKWVEEQRALGNPKILPKDVWLKQNANKIMDKKISELKDSLNNKLDILDSKMNQILAKK